MFGCNQRRLLGIAAVCVGGGIALTVMDTCNFTCRYCSCCRHSLSFLLGDEFMKVSCYKLPSFFRIFCKR